MLETIGERLRKARENAGLKQNRVCELLEIPKVQTFSAYERDVNEPKLRTLEKLAKIYNASIDWLVCGEEAQCQRTKTTTDYITDLFNAIDKLGLPFLEEYDGYNDRPTGRYIVRLVNGKLREFNLLIGDLYKIYNVKGAIDDDDFQMLVQKKIKDRAAESNSFEVMPQPDFDESLLEQEDLPPF